MSDAVCVRGPPSSPQSNMAGLNLPESGGVDLASLPPVVQKRLTSVAALQVCEVSLFHPDMGPAACPHTLLCPSHA